MPVDKDVAEAKRFFNSVKLHLNSLTAKRCGFMYVGVADNKNEYILSNMEPETYIKFCDATFCIHILKIKDDQIAKDTRQLLSMLKIPTNTPFVVKIPPTMTILNKLKGNLADFEVTVDENRIIYYYDKEKDKKIVLGYPMVIFQSIRIIYDFYKMYGKMKTDDMGVKVIEKDIIKESLDGGVIRAEFEIDPYFDTCDQTGCTEAAFSIVLVDGAETISNKEYIKKIKHDFNYKLITWLKDQTIEYGTYFRDKNVELRSSRPHTRIYIRKDKKGVK